jgi:hypothetical protein
MIKIDNITLPANAAAGTVVGNLGSVDPTGAVVPANFVTDSAEFEIVNGNQLALTSPLSAGYCSENIRCCEGWTSSRNDNRRRRTNNRQR